MEIVHTIGRRKTSIARIFMSEGKGNISVNKKRLRCLFPDFYLTIQNQSTLFIDQYRRELRFKNHC